jgi:hypothetical protein
MASSSPAVLMPIPDLARVDRDEPEELVVEAWLTRAQKRVGKPWLAEHGVADDSQAERRSPR